jgi:MFS family permease
VLTDKVGGKFILLSGLPAWAGGLLWVVAVAGAGTGWPSLVAPLSLIGLGAGCTFAPMATEVMRGVPVKLAGAASGVNNALRQVGSVLAGAAMGPTVAVSVGVLLLGALACLAVRRHTGPSPAGHGLPAVETDAEPVPTPS